ncbi:polyprenyl synthetase family protein [Rubellimicrobium roseum]|uniref:Octaprenyl diphosphate synthase n=1 Tax=Rubellimicrobium roseum TaxID=687525 RepID=A0A5C4NJY0_9RHOB|nr:polyprenyl synthetase family protein [Rubellimicrobium roseum]TNC74205.1 polyprenyl synthetase family protein [Rubellimicrobium roseum]
MSLDHARAKPHDRLAAALEADLGAVGALIRERMQSEAAPRIPAVTAHLIEAGGKRLRPMLVLAAARLLGYAGPFHVHLAVAVEFIHTATLLHDDVVDDSKQRRGRPTANLLWDNMSSVLVGDYLFARSFQLMVEAGDLRVLGILSDASATISEGEVLQLVAARDLATTEDTYLKVIRGKTAALFSAATQAGAVVAGADATQEEALRDYGDALGIAFQIIDDLLDIEGTDAIGKNRGDDLREGKLTLPVIRAVAAASDEERAFWTRVIARGQVEDADIERARDLMKRHGALASTRAEAEMWVGRAKAALGRLPGHPLREMLSDLADYVVAREA